MNLILFFNGWGMSSQIFSNFLPLNNYQIEILSYPYDTSEIDFGKYNHIYIVGWSFGVYYASSFLDKFTLKNYTAIAINGTPEIIGKNGITPGIFDLTLNTLDKKNLSKFYNNMEVSDNFLSPERDIAELKKELEILKNFYHPFPNYFHKVFVGKRDKIVPTSKQLKYFKDKGIEIIQLDCGHYPFSLLDSWNKIIEDV